jgi:hypothetical protein
MNRQFVDQSSEPLRTSGLMLQRKCDCGNHTVAGAECNQCQKKRQNLQRPAVVSASPLLHAGPLLQRAAAGEPGAAEFLPSMEATTPAGPTSETAPTPVPAAPTAKTGVAVEGPGLLVEDEAIELQAGQMRRSEFLAELRSEVCATADSALAETEQSTEGCPYLDFWFKYYEGQSSSHIERAIHRYAPETAFATSARAYIPLVAQRVRQGVERWARTGEISGVPEGVPLGVPGSLGGLVSGVGSLFFKAREGGARPAGDHPAAVQEELGPGKPLQSSVRNRMERAFGQSFGDVRTHTDSTARQLSNEHNARAFTVGNHVAFGAGEYRPGTLVGDALIAHEFAHVVQQNGSGTEAPVATGDSTYRALEENADEVAAGALSSLAGSAKGALTAIAQQAAPRLKSGLRLSRCDRQTTASVRTVTINTTVLAGANDNSAADTRTTNRILTRSNCGLQVSAGTPQTLEPGPTSAILGTDNLLEEPSGATVSSEEQQLVSNNRDSGRITAYYVPGFNPSKRGTSLQSPRHGVADSLLMGPSAASDTFAHELGHILARDPTHHSDPDNLMASGEIRNVGVDNVTTTQCNDFLTKTSYPQ